MLCKREVVDVKFSYLSKTSNRDQFQAWRLLSEPRWRRTLRGALKGQSKLLNGRGFLMCLRTSRHDKKKGSVSINSPRIVYCIAECSRRKAALTSASAAISSIFSCKALSRWKFISFFHSHSGISLCNSKCRRNNQLFECGLAAPIKFEDI